MADNFSQFRLHHSREEQDAASNLALLCNGVRNQTPMVIDSTHDKAISNAENASSVHNNYTRAIKWKKRDRQRSKIVSNSKDTHMSAGDSPEANTTDVVHPNPPKKLKTKDDHDSSLRSLHMPAPVSYQTLPQAVQTPIVTNVTSMSNKQVKVSVEEDGKCPSLAPAPFFFYRDHSQTPDEDPLTPLTPPGRVPNFPAKMHAILSRPDLEDVVAWLPHGRSWRVLKPREFEIRVIPIYFEHSKFSSFIRQANGWGFRRITQGRDRNSYYNELFLRGLPHLCKNMRRPGVNQKPTADPEHEPDFAKISETYPLPENVLDDESIMLECTVKGGPKARMPVSFRGASASMSNSSAFLSNMMSPSTGVTSPQENPLSSSTNAPSLKHPTLSNTASSMLNLVSSKDNSYENNVQMQLPSQQEHLIAQNHSAVFSSLQLSLQAAQDQMLKQQQQAILSNQAKLHPHFFNIQPSTATTNLQSFQPPLQYQDNHNMQQNQNAKQLHDHKRIQAQVPNSYLNELVKAQAQAQAHVAQVSNMNVNMNFNNMGNTSANAAANHLHSAASHFRSALSHALALSNTPEFLAAVATTTRPGCNQSLRTNPTGATKAQNPSFRDSSSR